MLLRPLALIALAALMLGGACGGSCVNFDGQTIRMHVDTEADRLDALLVYHDLHATGDDLVQPIEQLEMIRDGRRWFALLSNWPVMLDVDGLAEQEDDPERPATASLRAKLLANVSVTNGSVWTDADGRLNGWQLVRITPLADTIATLNAAWREEVEHDTDWDSPDEDDPLEDAASLALLRQWLLDGEDAFAFRRSAPTFTMPASDEGYAALKRWLLDGLESMLGEQDDDAVAPGDAERQREALKTVLAVNDWAIERTPGRVTFVFGNPDTPELRWDVPRVGNEHADGLTAALAERGWQIADGDLLPAAHAAYQAAIAER